ncbi:hypothetical protein KSP39_PZI020209 [Platanthera zijinensis]|uniref:Mediator of RNA polymerase II transcription subunit 6 n=1 Tax=Platanthera zijinensis TaxID=2320716 RepID=A0AAP0B013_9ASPA
MSPPPGTDMARICSYYQLWLNTDPLEHNLVLEYFVFALSPFYDWNCNNVHMCSRCIHHIDSSYLALNFDCLKSLFWLYICFPLC